MAGTLSFPGSYLVEMHKSSISPLGIIAYVIGTAQVFSACKSKSKLSWGLAELVNLLGAVNNAHACRWRGARRGPPAEELLTRTKQTWEKHISSAPKISSWFSFKHHFFRHHTSMHLFPENFLGTPKESLWMSWLKFFTYMFLWIHFWGTHNKYSEAAWVWLLVKIKRTHI